MPWLMLATIVTYAPVILHGFPPDGWDSRYHGVAAAEFARQLFGGELYPRWLMDMNAGLGGPHFFYYAPLSYYISSGFHLLHIDQPFAQMGAAAVLLGFMSGVTAFWWLARVLPLQPAIAGAVLYLAAPNHVTLNLYILADYAKFASMTFTPLALLGVELFLEKRRQGLVVIALGLAGSILCNVLTGLVIVGIPLFYLICRIGWPPRRATLQAAAWVLGASVVGLGLTAFYLLPALAYQNEAHVPIKALLRTDFLFGGGYGGIDGLKSVMFVGELVGAVALVGLTWIMGARSAFVTACAILAATCFLLMGVWSRPLWLLFPVTASLQFTSRLFLVVDLAMAGLLGAFLAALPLRLGRPAIAGAGSAILLLAAAGGVIAVRAGRFDYDTALWEKRFEYRPDYRLFRPSTAVAPLPADDLPLYSGGVFGTLPAPLPQATALAADASVAVVRWQPRDIVLDVASAAGSAVQIRQLYVPGWRAADEASGQALAVAPATPRGIVQIDVPAGAHRVRVRLAWRLPEYAGAAISLASLATVLAWLGWLFHGRARRRPTTSGN